MVPATGIGSGSRIDRKGRTRCDLAPPKPHAKAATVVDQALHLDLCTVRHADVFDNQRPEPGATVFPRPAGINPEESVKNLGNRPSGNTYTRVRYFKHATAVILCSTQSDATARRRKSDRIIEQI